jgi:hypothetical protein
MIKSRNTILEKKLGDYFQKIMALKSRSEYINSAIPPEIEFGIQTERQEPKKEKIYFEETFAAKPRHKKEKSSIFPQPQSVQNIKSSDHTKSAKRDNQILQIKIEKNKIMTAERELLELLTSE